MIDRDHMWQATVTHTAPAIPARLRPAFSRFWETGDEEALWLAIKRWRAWRRHLHTTYPAKWRRP